MSKEIRAIQIGVGAMGSLSVRYMHDHGVKIVGASDINPDLIGKDVGKVANIGKLGVLIEGDTIALIDKTEVQYRLRSSKRLDSAALSLSRSFK